MAALLYFFSAKCLPVNFTVYERSKLIDLVVGRAQLDLSYIIWILENRLSYNFHATNCNFPENE